MDALGDLPAIDKRQRNIHKSSQYHSRLTEVVSKASFGKLDKASADGREAFTTKRRTSVSDGPAVSNRSTQGSGQNNVDLRTALSSSSDASGSLIGAPIIIKKLQDIRPLYPIVALKGPSCRQVAFPR